MSIDLRAIELSLLGGVWKVGDTVEKHSLLPLAEQAVNGEFPSVLNSNYAQDLLALNASIEGENALAEPFTRWFSFVCPSLTEEADLELLRLVVAVACLHAFLQVNWTGPNLDIEPSAILSASVGEAVLTEDELNQKSIAELTYGGEPAYHLARVATFLRIAQLLLDLPYRHVRSASWWRFRCALVHQRILDEPVALPGSFTDPLNDPALAELLIDEPDFSGRLQLERGQLDHVYAHDSSAAAFFVRAARETGLEYELTGALGKRTKFQQTAHSQLVLLARSRSREDNPKELAAAVEDTGHTSSDSPALFQVAAAVKTGNLPETLSLNDDTLLERTQFTSSSTGSSAANSELSELDPGNQPTLHPLDQCILLSLCLNVRNTSPAHGLTSEQMSPYVERVITHPRNWSVHTMALLLRSRLESTRTRTVERSTFQLQALIDQMPTSDSTLAERLLHIHDIPLPSKWEMERELAARFLSLGVTKSALDIFERLEMWEEVVKCWQSLERRDKGIAIVRDLLEGRKAEADTVIYRGKVSSERRIPALDTAREAKLWCFLGDLEPENAEAHYNRAWAVSGETSGRAMRSLGGYYFARTEYTAAAKCLRRAVAINPLLERTWFILGCACVREEDWEGAREAFARCVSIDDEDGESWNNLASVYLRMGEAGKVARVDEEPEVTQGNLENDGNEVHPTDEEKPNGGIPFSNKLLAFRALRQGLKFKFESWRMWANYMIVAVDVGELAEACRAVQRVVEEQAEKVGSECVDLDVVERLVDAVTRAPKSAAADGTIGPNPNDGAGLGRRVFDLLERTILPRFSDVPRIFRAYARLLTWQSRWSDAVSAHMNAYRCSPAATLKSGEGASSQTWREALAEVEELVGVLQNFGPRAEEGPKTWRSQARSVVRGFIGRTRADFEDEPEWEKLLALEEEVKGLEA